MKRILVIDDSEVVQETLDIVLGGEFSVVKRPVAKNGDPLASVEEQIDLLILGVHGASEPLVSGLIRSAERAAFAVLFLVDSQFAAQIFKRGKSARVSCLVKPFNPYDLVNEIRVLLGGETLSRDLQPAVRSAENQLEKNQYIEYPYINRVAASLVHRFAASRLPILIVGEVGCGRENVARAICSLDGPKNSSMVIHAEEIAADYVARKRQKLSELDADGSTSVTLLINDIDRLSRSEQALLMNFLEAGQGEFGSRRFLATAGMDLLEQVYRGNFLESLYYKLSTLTLKLVPLRDRKEDIAYLAERYARSIAKNLGLDGAVLTTGAVERLSNYLWFGNVGELETVISRTLVTHGRSQIDAADLIFDFPTGAGNGSGSERNPHRSADTDGRMDSTARAAPQMTSGTLTSIGPSDNGSPKESELNVLIHELAHELKNPMVTIKTFAQLLGDRYQDHNFRGRFQSVVGDDIERMDGVLEMMIEFSNFSRPRIVGLALDEKVRSVIREMSGELAKRQTGIRWRGKPHAREIRADDEQIRYVLKNTLATILSQIKTGSELDIDIEKKGSVAFSYALEEGRVRPITHYLGVASGESEKAIWPLRILLAKHLVEQNGGRMAMHHANDERETLTVEFPVD